LSGAAGTGLCDFTKADILDNWLGNAMDENGNPIGTTLSVNSDTAELKFGTPRKCASTGEYVMSEANVHTYRIITPSHSSVYGWCTKVRDGMMVITQTDKDTLSVMMTKNNRAVGQWMTFKRKKAN
jgi:hypothetical protein